jgi:hypothetical protein
VQNPAVAGEHLRTEVIIVVRSLAAEIVRQLDHGISKVFHQLIDGFYGHGFCFFNQMCVNTCCGWGAMAQPSLGQPQVDAGFQKMRWPGALNGIFIEEFDATQGDRAGAAGLFYVFAAQKKFRETF